MLLSQQRAVKWPEKEASFSNSPNGPRGQVSWAQDSNSQQRLPPPQAPPLPRGLLGVSFSLEDRYLDLILRVVDHESIGQGVLGERGEVGLGQQGL